ncbi:GH36 C-terminal domain-containing protein [Nonomuraea sp. CA-143628]|uniref:GH36 C-terminal domain-containing protein n=1 Tax=Nonomuraea sp. CA-143628 TaxID=3239997 RepID=UPI003D8FB17F
MDGERLDIDAGGGRIDFGFMRYTVRLTGLDPQALYELEADGSRWYGATLMASGIRPAAWEPIGADHRSEMVVLRKVKIGGAWPPRQGPQPSRVLLALVGASLRVAIFGRLACWRRGIKHD